MASRALIVEQILASSLVLGALTGAALGCPLGGPLGEGTRLKTDVHFEAPNSDNPKKQKPRGISGMACLEPGGDGLRQCLVINDEERAAQVATLTAQALTPNSDKGLVKFVEQDGGIDNVVGTMPQPHCPKPDPEKSDELDGEGVAFAEDRFYVAGSHSCSRKKGEFNRSAFLLGRFKIEGPDHIRGSNQPKIEHTWRLADVLPHITVHMNPEESDAARNIFDENQPNVEGIAIVKGRLYAGLRTPYHDGGVSIVSAKVDDLFAEKDKPLKPEIVAESRSREILVRLPPDTGIRDLAAMNDGGLLILTGPTLEQPKVDYRLYRLKELNPGVVDPQLLGVLPKEMVPGKDEVAKAETVTIVGETKDKATVLILYDNVDEGFPTLHEVPLCP
jgi:hypothetical protein